MSTVSVINNKSTKTHRLPVFGPVAAAGRSDRGLQPVLDLVGSLKAGGSNRLPLDLVRSVGDFGDAGGGLDRRGWKATGSELQRFRPRSHAAGRAARPDAEAVTRVLVEILRFRRLCLSFEDLRRENVEFDK